MIIINGNQLNTNQPTVSVLPVSSVHNKSSEATATTQTTTTANNSTTTTTASNNSTTMFLLSEATPLGNDNPDDVIYAYANLSKDEQDMIVNVTKEYPLEFATIMFGYIMPLMLLITLVTNTLVVLVLFQRHMRTPTNIVLFAMAIIDLLTLISPSPWYILIYTLKYHDSFLYPTSSCYLHHIMIDVLPVFFHTASIWLAVLLAGQRYIYVCHPSLASTWCTVPRVKRAILTILILAFLHQFLRFFDSTFNTVRLYHEGRVQAACRHEISDWVNSLDASIYYTTYFGFRILFVNIGPCTALITLNCLLFKALREAENKRFELFRSKLNYGQQSSSTIGSTLTNTTTNNNINTTNISITNISHNGKATKASLNQQQQQQQQLQPQRPQTPITTINNQQCNNEVHSIGGAIDHQDESSEYDISNRSLCENSSCLVNPQLVNSSSGGTTSNDVHLQIVDCDPLSASGCAIETTPSDCTNNNNNSKRSQSIVTKQLQFNQLEATATQSEANNNNHEQSNQKPENSSNNNKWYKSNSRKRKESSLGSKQVTGNKNQSQQQPEYHASLQHRPSMPVPLGAQPRTIDSNRTTMMLIVVVTVFLIVEIPVAVNTIAHVLLNSFDLFKDIDYQILIYVKLCSNFLILLSYPVNFSIYCSMSSSFRETFTDLFVRGNILNNKRDRPTSSRYSVAPCPKVVASQHECEL